MNWDAVERVTRIEMLLGFPLDEEQRRMVVSLLRWSDRDIVRFVLRDPTPARVVDSPRTGV